MLKNFHLKYRNMLKPLKGKKDCKAYSAEVEAFRTQAQRKLFDTVACKCKLPSSCSCSKERIILKEEHEFILDKISERKMAIIGGWVWKSSWKMTAKMLRKQVKPIGFEAPRGGAYNNRKHLKLETPCS